MSCYNFNAGVPCNQCHRFVKSLSVEIGANGLTITIPDMVCHNNERICLCIAQPIPDTVTENTLVIITSGTSNFYLITRFGNLVYADSIRSRKVYPIVFATDTNIAVLQEPSKLCDTGHIFPIILPPQTMTKKVSEVANNKERDF